MDNPDSRPADQRRPIWRRILLVLLSMVASEAGLLRIGKPRLALSLFATTLLLIFAFALLPSHGHERQAALIYALLLAGLVMIFVLGAAATWRWSATVNQPRAWYSRSWAIAAYVIVCVVASSFATARMQGTIKNFYTPAASTQPTFRIGDRLVADLRQPVEVQRGDLVIVRARGTDYVKRVIAIGGDTVSIKDGVPVLDGIAVSQRPDGTEPAEWNGQSISAKRYVETIGAHSYRVLDLGLTPQDDTVPVKVPPGMFFVLGDNRDNSEDSRFDPLIGGLGLVRQSDIVGRPMFRGLLGSHPLESLADQ